MEKEYDGCDGALWHIGKTVVRDQTYNDVSTTIYRYNDKTILPSDLGFKYHVLTYKEDDGNSAEVMSAYIGDVLHFINNHAKAGYNGMLVKDKAIPKKDIKIMFSKILSNWKFEPKVIKSIIKQV